MNWKIFPTKTYGILRLSSHIFRAKGKWERESEKWTRIEHVCEFVWATSFFLDAFTLHEKYQQCLSLLCVSSVSVAILERVTEEGRIFVLHTDTLLYPPFFCAVHFSSLHISNHMIYHGICRINFPSPHKQNQCVTETPSARFLTLLSSQENYGLYNGIKPREYTFSDRFSVYSTAETMSSPLRQSERTSERHRKGGV